MKLAKIFITFAFLLAFALKALAQGYTYPNELKGFELFRNGRWKSLKPLVSTKEDVEKIFGKGCHEGCDYDENWRVEIMYISQCWSYTGTEKLTPTVAEEMIGKYSNLNFYPKKRIERQPLKFGKQFESRGGGGASHASPSIYNIYSDSLGLNYQISAENTEDGKYHEGDLVSIIYGWSDSDYEKYKNKIKC
jgi:hypothetical protein